MLKDRDYDKHKAKSHKRKVKKGVWVAILIAAVIGFLIGYFAVKGVKSLAKPSSTPAVSSSSAVSSSAASSKPDENIKYTKTIPILMYHSIAYEKNNILRVPKDKFDAEMKWLYDNGYKTITLDDVYNGVESGKGVPEKSVVITFDDGYVDNYQNAFPVLKKYGFTGTTFMITKSIDDPVNGYLSGEQLKEMDADCLKVESHTVTHGYLSEMSYDEQLKELKDSKAALEKLLGHEVKYLAFPTGKYDENTIKAAKEAGYNMCFKMNGGQGTVSDSKYEFPRFFVGENLDDFISRVKGTAEYSK